MDKQQLFPDGRYPKWAPGMPFSLRAAYVNGYIQAIRLGPGGGVEGEPFLLRTVDGPLEVEDQPFELFTWTVVSQPFCLLVNVRGEGGVSEWLSSDDGATWIRAAEYWERLNRAKSHT